MSVALVRMRDTPQRLIFRKAIRFGRGWLIWWFVPWREYAIQFHVGPNVVMRAPRM